jgi:hypothetical protein
MYIYKAENILKGEATVAFWEPTTAQKNLVKTAMERHLDLIE